MAKKFFTVGATLIFINIILFLISHWAFMRKQNDTSLMYPDAWFSQVLAVLILSRFVSTVIIGFFFRKRKWFASMNAKKYTRIFCMLLFFWGIYYFHHFEDEAYNFIMYNLAQAPNGNYYEVSLIWMFLYETFVAAHSWFSYIICGAIIMFPRRIRKKKLVTGTFDNREVPFD